jgi:hypothetical protein
MSALEKQISDMYNKAFYDIIDETINSEKPDYNWIVNLYSEIKNRLLKYIKKDSKTYKQIDEQFDIILFRQTIENNVFDMDSLLRLVNTTYYWIKMLQAPIRDQSTEQSKNNILTAKPEKMVSTYIREVNKCLDYLDEDLVKFLEITKENS